MTIKLIGAILIIGVCAGFGYSMVSAHRKEERCLQQMMGALDYMQCELQYRLTPLPELCREAARQSDGAVQTLFTRLSVELEDQIAPDASQCMHAALAAVDALPQRCTEAAIRLGKTLGRFDLEGQLAGMEAVRHFCRQNLSVLADGRGARLRSYQTLGLCAGAALVILFI
jgi:stage III sporulation protein AB